MRSDNDQPAKPIAVHGGTLLINGMDEAESNSASSDGAVADPERWINQARKVDRAVLERLRRFVAYLAKGSQGQR